MLFGQDIECSLADSVDLHLDMVRNIAFGRENIFVFSAEEERRGSGKSAGGEFLVLLRVSQIDQRRRSVAADRDVGEAYLDHVSSVGYLIEVPFLAAHGGCRFRAIIVKNHVTRPAG